MNFTFAKYIGPHGYVPGDGPKNPDNPDAPTPTLVYSFLTRYYCLGWTGLPEILICVIFAAVFIGVEAELITTRVAPQEPFNLLWVVNTICATFMEPLHHHFKVVTAAHSQPASKLERKGDMVNARYPVRLAAATAIDYMKRLETSRKA